MMEVKSLESIMGVLYEWHPNELHTRKCPFCASQGVPRFRRPDNLIINHCRFCNTYYVSPAPNEDSIVALYSNYWNNRSGLFNLPALDHQLAQTILKTDPAADIRITEISSIKQIANSKVLEIGFGLGQTMVQLQKLGADVFGVDTDPACVDFASKLLGLNVLRGTIKDCDISGKYDLILLFDLIEHPLNPLELLTEARKLLQRNGVLAIWTPNASFIQEEETPILFRVDLEHMQYLSFETCRYIAEALELRIVHLESIGFPSLEIKNQRPNIYGPHTLGQSVKEIIKRIPGAIRVKRTLSQLLFNPGQVRTAIDYSEQLIFRRNGKYHLFCLLQNGD